MCKNILRTFYTLLCIFPLICCACVRKEPIKNADLVVSSFVEELFSVCITAQKDACLHS